MTFQVFAKEDCVLCHKAQAVLARLDIKPLVRYVEGSKATPEDIADFAWYDWSDKMPLVVVTEGEQVLHKWNGGNVEGRWMPEVRKWLEEHPAVPASGS